MVIKSLKLKNYRNYWSYLIWNLIRRQIILYGDNAQGKTNILEALYLSGTTKSHRGTKDRDVIQFGYDESHIETIIEKRNIDFQIDMHLKKNSPKGIAIDKFRSEEQVNFSGSFILCSFHRKTEHHKRKDRQGEEDLLIWNFHSSIKFISIIFLTIIESLIREIPC